jgi:hypothetical protein
MNSLQLEQRKMSSFFSISIVHTGGFLLREYPYALRPFCQREVSSTEKKQTDLSVLHTDRKLLGILPLRFQ